jgi:mono/diheme cytochrome c family protein
MLRPGLIFALGMIWGMHSQVYAQTNDGKTGGALLYSTYCNACHTSKIHWREQKLATDLDSLYFQVRRWQDNIGLDWSEAEIADVVRYLNAVYYDFPEDKKSTPAP